MASYPKEVEDVFKVCAIGETLVHTDVRRQLRDFMVQKGSFSAFRRIMESSLKTEYIQV
jgi:hypothetical protein